MVGSNVVFAQPFAEVVRHSLHQSPGVDKDQRRTMLLDESDECIIDLVPHLVGGDGPERAGRNFDRKVKLSLVPDIDDDRRRAAVSGEELRNLFDRLLRRRKSNADWRTMGQRFQPLQGESQMSAALIVCHRMNFIDDDRLHIAQDRPALLRG